MTGPGVRRVRTGSGAGLGPAARFPSRQSADRREQRPRSEIAASGSRGHVGLAQWRRTFVAFVTLLEGIKGNSVRPDARQMAAEAGIESRNKSRPLRPDVVDRDERQKSTHPRNCIHSPPSVCRAARLMARPALTAFTGPSSGISEAVSRESPARAANPASRHRMPPDSNLLCVTVLVATRSDDGPQQSCGTESQRYLRSAPRSLPPV